jgi:hypothetical protein
MIFDMNRQDANNIANRKGAKAQRIHLMIVGGIFTRDGDGCSQLTCITPSAAYLASLRLCG